VYRVARELGIGGTVRNHARGVTVEAWAPEDVLATLVETLRTGAPLPARVKELTTAPLSGEPDDRPLVIEHSDAGGERALSIPPDLATCPACLAEVDDVGDRRAGYVFTNCTACGPRFTIATGVPYDRAATTMTGFPMCPACRREYDEPLDRRFHAQPNACPVCGPRLALWDSRGRRIETHDPLQAAVARLRAGAIVAVKGLGGYHLACDATSTEAVALLRARKHRDHKPFAVMVASLAAAQALAELDDAEAALLAGPERPIVLVRRRAAERAGLAPLADGGANPAADPSVLAGTASGAGSLADGVAPDSELLGLLLPYTPLHHRLLAAVGRPLVMTSGNRADEPICCDDADAVQRLGAIADALLVHDRPIANHCDDSVARVIDGAPTLLRRSRGWVPRAIALAVPVPEPILAVGGQLKNTFCLAVGDRAYLGPHIGDLDHLAALEHFEDALARMAGLLQVQPGVIAHDLHPDYLSTRWALAQRGVRTLGVQHHHAHVASAIAEHGLDGAVIGVAFDGTGWGPDGTAWGGEVLLATRESCTRLATLRPIALAGGDAAIRAPWRIAVALLADALDGATGPIDDALARLPLFAAVAANELALVRRMLRTGLNVGRARGVGRYFDGIAALGLARPLARHEGQLAMAWNAIAAAGEHAPYPWAVQRAGDVAELDLRPMVRAIVADLTAAVAPSRVSARFHATMIAATAEVVLDAIAAHGRLPIVLTGGSFVNPILSTGLTVALAGLDVRRHGEVPPGDGGLALGQAVIAGARLARATGGR
jgi:hydrogenase maturation protein HypF